jgi:hypothetical protein
LNLPCAILGGKVSRNSNLRIVSLMATLAVVCPLRSVAAKCTVVDLMPEYRRLVSESRNQSPKEQVVTFHRGLDLSHTDLYSKTGVGFQTEEHLNGAILKALGEARQNLQSVLLMSETVSSSLPQEVARFEKVFPDFRCNFPIYLVPSLGNLDGAGRIVDGRPALVLGIDSMASEFSGKPLQLRIFLDHEIFHRYHSQVSGFSDDKGQEEVIWRGLWAEGLATYVSMVLNPAATMQDALFFPTDLESRASPIRSRLAKQLEDKLDISDPRIFQQYFSYHAGDVDGVPPRSSYYIGALAAQRLAQQYSLTELIHLRGDAVRKELEETLIWIAR